MLDGVGDVLEGVKIRSTLYYIIILLTYITKVYYVGIYQKSDVFEVGYSHTGFTKSTRLNSFKNRTEEIPYISKYRTSYIIKKSFVE